MRSCHVASRSCNSNSWSFFDCLSYYNRTCNRLEMHISCDKSITMIDGNIISCSWLTIVTSDFYYDTISCWFTRQSSSCYIYSSMRFSSLIIGMHSHAHRRCDLWFCIFAISCDRISWWCRVIFETLNLTNHAWIALDFGTWRKWFDRMIWLEGHGIFTLIKII